MSRALSLLYLRLAAKHTGGSWADILWPAHRLPACTDHPSSHPLPAGILYALLHVPDLVAAIPGAQADVEGALRYVLTLECDAEGSRGEGSRERMALGIQGC